MAIDKTIYTNGINGNLSYWEIESLPKDYEVYKSMFKAASEKRGKFYPRPMSKLEEEKRFMQVLTRASYGMSRENEFLKCEEYGVMTKWQRFKMKLKFIFNFKKWWHLFMLRRELKKSWGVDRKQYKKANLQTVPLCRGYKQRYWQRVYAIQY